MYPQREESEILGMEEMGAKSWGRKGTGEVEKEPESHKWAEEPGDAKTKASTAVLVGLDYLRYGEQLQGLKPRGDMAQCSPL